MLAEISMSFLNPRYWEKLFQDYVELKLFDNSQLVYLPVPPELLPYPVSLVTHMYTDYVLTSSWTSMV